MCGIAGRVWIEGANDPDLVRQMCDVMAHRGPDADGLWSDETCSLGHRRLAIIDLSEAGRQPMTNEDGSVWITFNGEIYNFVSLREELQGLGHRFRTRTDTECIIHAYEQWGADCPKRLRGMFAFAIWDRSARRLYMARDRVGKKPLFYSHTPTRFSFASELQGLLAEEDARREVDIAAIDSYLSWGYIPAPRTGFVGISKLPPAHWLSLDLGQAEPKFQCERYWTLQYTPKLGLSEQDACDGIRDILTESVRLRMVSDVPLGAFLSGGIDSSIVVGLMASLSDRPVKTFSIGFDEGDYNELGHARRIAEKWSTDHHELVVTPNALEVLPKLVRHYGEPYADSSAVPTFYVAQITRKDVTVALNGDGGDESFAGYERYRGNLIAERMRRLPGSKAVARSLSNILPDSINSKSKLRRARRFLNVADQPMSRRYSNWIGYFDDAAKSCLYDPDFKQSLNGHRPTDWLDRLFQSASSLNPVDAAMCVDVVSYLPYDLLVKVDITSMSNSLEARSPFLDHEVMEFAARLPAELKLRGSTHKYLLKRAFTDLLPPENVNRRKMGFGVPVGEWFRGALRSLLQDSLTSAAFASRRIFNPTEVRRLVNEHVQRQADHSFQLWSLLMLELWHKEMVDAAPNRRELLCAAG